MLTASITIIPQAHTLRANWAHSDALSHFCIHFTASVVEIDPSASFAAFHAFASVHTYGISQMTPNPKRAQSSFHVIFFPDQSVGAPAPERYHFAAKIAEVQMSYTHQKTGINHTHTSTRFTTPSPTARASLFAIHFPT